MNRKNIVNRKLPGRYGRMNAAKLDQEVEKFDQEFIADTARPMTAQERARERGARRKRGRPPIGKGARRVLVTIERDLLDRSDHYAKTHKITRAALIARGLEVVVGSAR